MTFDLKLKHRLAFETVRIEPDDAGWMVVFTRAGGKAIRLPIGDGFWREGTAVFEDAAFERLGAIVGEQPVASSGAWEGRVFRSRTYLHNTVNRLDLAFDFKEDGRLELDVSLTGMSGARAKGIGTPR